MKYHVIGDEDTVLGFRFAGIPGQIVREPAEAREALSQASRRPDLAIVIIADTVAGMIREEVNQVRFNRELPLVVVVPGPSGPSQQRANLLDLIREAVGIKV